MYPIHGLMTWVIVTIFTLFLLSFLLSHRRPYIRSNLDIYLNLPFHFFSTQVTLQDRESR